jgi:ribosome-associated protein
LTSKEKALSLAEAICDRKGLEVRVLDLRGVASFSDFFIIASATSDRHARALAQAVQERSHELGDRPIGVEGEETGRWILIDLGDVVVHVFQEEARAYYDLERLWGEAESVEVEAAVGGTP